MDSRSSIFLVYIMIDFEGNDSQKNVFNAFLSQNEVVNPVMIVISPNGLGKTTFCQKFFLLHNYHVIRPIYEHFSSNKDFFEYISVCMSTLNINNQTKKKNVLFLDDIEILLAIDRYSAKCICDLIKIVEKRNKQTSNHFDWKIVITCSHQEERKISELKKKTKNIIRLETPSVNACYDIVCKHISEKRSAPLELFEQERVLSLIKTMKCNISSIIGHLNDIVIESKYSNLNLFDLCITILKNPEGDVNDLLIPLSCEPTIVNYILYDNLHSFISKFYFLDPLKYRIGIKKVIDAFIFGSVIESQSFKNTSIKNIEWTHLIKAGFIREFQKTLKPKPNFKEAQFPIIYTSIPVRSSRHYCHKKRLDYLYHSHDLNEDNLFTICEIACEQNLHRKQDFPNLDCYFIFNTFKKMFCVKNKDVYSKRIKRLKKSHPIQKITLYDLNDE